MEIIEFNPKNFYTCQFCKNEFETPQEMKVYQNVSPLCSYRCKFNVVYKILQKYTPEDLLFIANYFRVKFPKEKLVFELTKIIVRRIFSSVSSVCSNELTKQSG